ncbi:sugar ABC transporter ATP-binding protein [Treponema primitia]|uniref:sugar ABC transporter ATP-binding protein n=1 Tax=Treponema primitia TaxID=88058 RepID=UPI000685A7F4|nr:sugar ABC transporter ATP-binding protein [Treponema primitia]
MAAEFGEPMENDGNSNAGLGKEILRLVDIDKSFPGVHAVNKISFTLHDNEIVGICGENGAGKSTLLKMISGVYHQDSGEIYYLGERVDFRSPEQSIRAGISIIYQELSNLDNLTVAENVFLGRYPLTHGIVDWKRLNRDVKELMSRYNLDIPPTALMSSLHMAEKQLVEIVKSISTHSRVIIMDEPTSSLGIDNVAKLMDIVRRVHADGISFIFISHRLDELIEICDRIVVLRDGSSVASFEKKDFDKSALVAQMVGREMKQFYTKIDIEKGDTVLELDKVSTRTLRNVSLKVQKGSIVGLYGMAGNGQDDILRLIFGLKTVHTGTIKLFGKPYIPKNPEHAIQSGVVYISEDRRGTGLSLIHTIRDNIGMANFSTFSRYGIMNWKGLTKSAGEWMDKLKIKAPSINTVTGNLSGGNQQKVILGKWIENKPRIILFNEPTRGIDVGAKYELFQIVQELCKEGIAVLMISSDMLEMLSMADSIYTVCEGMVTACFGQKEATQEKLLRAAINLTEEK